jgi:hypothetical protein
VTKSSGAWAEDKMEPDTKDYDISENAEVVKIDKKMIISVGLKPNVRFL